MENNYILAARSLLAQADVIIDKHSTITKETGGLFNVFSILNMERLEVQTHSAFLYELMNPKGSHSQGDTYLKLFIEDVLEIDDFVYKNIIVDRERGIGSNGRLDLVIENDDYLLIIEVKIDAGDQDYQLKRYDDYGKTKGKEYKIYYLTLFGAEPSEQSLGGKGSIIDYKCLSFSFDILNWIKTCIGAGKTPLLPTIRETLLQYAKLLEKITNQIDGGLTMELKEILLKGNNLEIAEQLAKTVQFARAELEYRFWKEFYDRYNNQIEALGFKLLEDDFFKDKNDDINTIVEERKKRGGDITFDYSIGKYNNQELSVLIGQSGYDKTVYMSFLVYEKDDYIKYTNWNKKLLSIVEGLGFTFSSNNKYRYTNTTLNFYDDSIYKLLNEDSFKQIVKLIGDELLEVFIGIKNNNELWKLIN